MRAPGRKFARCELGGYAAFVIETLLATLLATLAALGGPAETVPLELRLVTAEGLPYDGPWTATVGAEQHDCPHGVLRVRVRPGTMQIRAEPAGVRSRGAIAVETITVRPGAPRSVLLRLGSSTRVLVIVRTRCSGRIARAEFRHESRLMPDESARCSRDLGTGVYAFHVRAGSRSARFEFAERSFVTRALRIAEVAMPKQHGSVCDLGYVATRPAALLASGRVLDAAGAPVEYAFVHPTPGRTVQTDEAGRFEIHGFPDQKALAIRAESGRCLADIVTFDQVWDRAPTLRVRTPALGLTIRLANTAQVETSLLVDPGIPHEVCHVFVRTADGNREPMNVVGERLVKSGLVAETVVVEAGFWAIDRALAERTVRLRPGQKTELPPIDVRGKIQSFRLRVVGVDGKPLDNRRVAFPGRDGVGHTGADGVLRAFAVRDDANRWPIVVTAGARKVEAVLTPADPAPTIVLP